VSSSFDVFLHRITEFGLEFFRKFYGLYDAKVMRVDDPDEQGGIQIQCLAAGHTTTVNEWVYPAFPAAGADRGMFWPPEKGDHVWVSFARGDPGKPEMYFGGWHGKKELPKELGYASKKPKRRGFVTRMGHMLIFNEEADKESVELHWHKPGSQPDDPKSAERTGKKASLVFDKEGTITLSNKNESTIVMDAKDKKITITDKDNSNKIVMDDKAITITGDKKVVVACDLIHLGKDGPSDHLALAKLTKAEIKAVRDTLKALVSKFNAHKHSVKGIKTAGPPPAHSQTAPVDSAAPDNAPADSPAAVADIKSVVVLSE